MDVLDGQMQGWRVQAAEEGVRGGMGPAHLSAPRPAGGPPTHQWGWGGADLPWGHRKGAKVVSLRAARRWGTRKGPPKPGRETGLQGEVRCHP